MSGGGGILNKDTHVYCTNCVCGKSLIQAIIDETDVPKQCDSCYPYKPESSVQYRYRPNYRDAIIQEMADVLQAARDKLEEYAYSDETADMYGAGVFDEPHDFIKDILNKIDAVLSKVSL